MIRELTKADVPAVVALHRKVLPDTLNAHMGERHLAELYGHTLASGSCLGFVSLSEAGELEGFILAADNLASLQAYLGGKIGLRRKLLMALRSLSRLKFLQELYGGVFRNQFKGIQTRKYGYILTIGVAAAARGSGCGRQLVDRLMDALAAWGHGGLCVDTRRENIGANRFYIKLGFRPIGSLAGTNYYAKDTNRNDS